MIRENKHLAALIRDRKTYLIVGVVILLMSLCIIFPFEKHESNFISDFVYTYISLAIGLLVLMYGLMGKNFFKGLLFLIFSSIFSFCAWMLFYPLGFLSTLLAFWLGIPSGIIAGLIFLIADYKFINDENRVKLFLKRMLLFLLLLAIVSLSFLYGSDLISYIYEKFK